MPLHRAAIEGHAAVVEQLLAAGAAVDAKVKVSGEYGADKGGLGGRRVLLVLFFCASRNMGVASRISKGIGHVTTV